MMELSGLERGTTVPTVGPLGRANPVYMFGFLKFSIKLRFPPGI